jgi:sigma-E factor negative regulatory protein RseC
MNATPPQMHEEGLVRSLHGRLAQVEMVQTDACQHCSAQGVCHAMGGEKVRSIAAENQAGAQVGDRVLLAAPRRGVLGAGFLVYMVPVLALIAGAAVGQKLGPDWGLSVQNGAVLTGLGSLAAAWLVLRQVSRKLGQKSSFKVRIVRVVRKGDSNAVD